MPATEIIYSQESLDLIMSKIEADLQRYSSVQDLGLDLDKLGEPTQAVLAVTAAFERLVGQVFMEMRAEEGAEISSKQLAHQLSWVAKQYRDRAEQKDPEAIHFQSIARFAWFLHNTRNYVSHLGRRVSADDRMEVLRAFWQVLNWRLEYCDLLTARWIIEAPVREVCPVTNSDGELSVPRSVWQLMEDFRRHYREQEYERLAACIDEDYVGRLYEEEDRAGLMSAIRGYHRDCDPDNIRPTIHLTVHGHHIDDDGQLWLHIKFVLHEEGADVETEVQFVRLRGLSSERARIVEIRQLRP